MRTRIIPLVALLLAGCGGGGGDDSAVSANPPASPPPVAATPAPQPAPAPPARVPDFSPIPSPPPATKPPVAAPGPAPDPRSPDPIVPQPPGPPPPTITAEVLDIALGTQIQGPTAVGQPQGFQGVPAYVAQDFHRDRNDPGTYRIGSAATTWTPDLEGTRTELGRTILSIREIEHNSGRWLGQQADGDGVVLYNADGFQATGTVALDRTLATWGGGAYFAHLVIQSDPASDTVFRLCFNVKLPTVIRLSCGIFDRGTGVLRGVHIVDDSQGLGALTWRTQ